MSTNLFASDGSDNDDLELNTNREYAKSYNYLRKKELAKKFKDRGYDVSDSETSSDTETSSDDEANDPDFDKEFFKTLASLKSKNPAIYDKSTKFFDNGDDGHTDEGDGGEEGESMQKSKKPKPVTLKDYERTVMLEKGGKFEDDTDDEQTEAAAHGRSASPTIVEEERRLKKEFQKVLNADDSDDEEFGGIFKKRERTQQEKDKEEEDFAAWLAGKKKDIEESVKSSLEPLKEYWDSDKLPQSERFLRDYVLNKGYANAKSSDIPTYDEIVADPEPLSEDEEQLAKEAEFEQKYNFRYEEPDTDFIKRYPRTIENSVRQKDDKRKQKREEAKIRKQEEKNIKMREYEMVKEMKRREIEEKIRKLKMVTGNDELGIKDDELEDDFDPEAHDRRMRELFNDEYYQVDEGEEKPEVPSDIEDLKVEDWDNYDPSRETYDDEPHCEDDDFNMDCDYDPIAAKEQMQQELIENTKRRKGRKGRRNRFMEMIQAEKPAFDPEDEKTYGEYIDEYYKLDCEDIIGDIPCRFKYVETTPNDFGLTIEEILLAKNKELNQWASLKKAIQIRPDQLEKKEQRLYKLKAKNEALKRKIFKSLYGEGSDDEQEQEEFVPYGEQKKATATTTSTATATTTAMATATTTAMATEETPQEEVSPADQKAKKMKRKQKRKAQIEAVAAVNVDKADNASPDEAPVKKPKETNADESTLAEAASTPSDATKTKKRNKKKKKNNNSTNKPPASTSKSDDTPQPKTAAQPKVVPASKPAKNSGQNPFSRGNQNDFSANKNKFNNSKGNAKSQGSGGVKKQNDKFKAKFRASSDSKNKKFGNRNKFKRNDNAAGKDGNGKISDDRLKAYGINPKKFHKKQKYSNKK